MATNGSDRLEHLKQLRAAITRLNDLAAPPPRQCACFVLRSIRKKSFRAFGASDIPRICATAQSWWKLFRSDEGGFFRIHSLIETGKASVSLDQIRTNSIKSINRSCAPAAVSHVTRKRTKTNLRLRTRYRRAQTRQHQATCEVRPKSGKL